MHLVLKEPSFNALHGKAYENHVDLYALENSMPLRDQVIKTLTPYYFTYMHTTLMAQSESKYYKYSWNYNNDAPGLHG